MEKMICYAGTSKIPAPIIKSEFVDSVCFRNLNRPEIFMEFRKREIPSEFQNLPWSKYS